MNRGFSCGGNKLGKQRPGEMIIGDHALGMPLHAGDPVGVAGPFDRFDHIVGRVRHDAKIFSRSEHGLVMRTVYPNFAGGRELGKA